MDTMASSPLTLLGNGTEEYKRLHGIAIQTRPDTSLEDIHFAVAVLQHDKDAANCVAEDFHWFKVKATHSVKKLKSAYTKKLGLPSIQFRLGNNPIADTLQMNKLNYLNDNIVIFTAYSDRNGTLSPSGTPSASLALRNPLQPVNTQLLASPQPATPNISTKPSVKSEQSQLPSQNRLQDIPMASSFPSPKKTLQSPVKNESQVEEAPQSIKPETPALVKPEVLSEEDEQMFDIGPPMSQQDQANRFQQLMAEGSPHALEIEVRNIKFLLQALRAPMEMKQNEQRDAKHWVQQIDALQKHKVDTPTIIGVVGNTGAGKSSVINAMLEEERLVPTNCMRACTAVVTELSWNSSDNPQAKYRAEIEFIKAADWAQDLKISLAELLDGNGEVSRDCANEESEAGIAYAKIKAVYPSKTKDMLAKSTVEDLMNEKAVRNVLGTTMKFNKATPEVFYRALQNIIDSKEKKKGEKKEMEYWPLIKVVKIYVKASALSTGAVIVDLPGVHDSNAARAAVAAGYMKQCTGLFIVAPINRAVDDKAAKSLLGESFKRQLKFDGTYSRITFICSKTDDISVTEASDSLGLEEKFAPDWDRILEIEKQTRELKKSIEELKKSRDVYDSVIEDAEDAIEVWDKLKGKLDDGEEVYAPSSEKKRKRSPVTHKPRKKAKKSADSDDDADSFIDDGSGDESVEEVEAEADDEQSKDNASDSGSQSDGKRDVLTAEAIDEKLAQLKGHRKRARAEKSIINTKLNSSTREIKALSRTQSGIEGNMNAVCIEGRNTYSRGAIQRDFADGIRELDMENAQEEDPDQFNPEDEIRDYEEVARTLPVFCVSSRAFQKLSGRLQRDSNISGFRSTEETEIPQLQAHCKKLTEGGRAANCRLFLTNFSQLLTSLSLWASNDGTGVSLSDAQLAIETRFLKTRLTTLEKSLEKAVKSCLKDMNQALAENIFENYDHVVELAIQQSGVTVGNWHRPVNRDDRPSGGYYWATYKAIMRRDGVFSNAQGPHDFNASLAEPIIKNLASHWERVFAQRLPRVLQGFVKESRQLLNSFHREIEARSMKLGTGVAGLGLLGQQLRNYEAIFTTLAQQMVDVINALQRDANREFTPAIAREFQNAYTWCSEQSGPGVFQRMKTHVQDHVQQNRNTMFAASVNEVKGRLVRMCSQVEDSMSTRADEVFMMMSRDYLSVMGGSQQAEGQAMPRWERKMRAEVAECIDNRDEVIADAKRALAAAKRAEAGISGELGNVVKAESSRAQSIGDL